MLFQDLGLLVLFLGNVLAEVPDPEKDIVQIADAASVVVGNYFYTVGGYATFKVTDDFPLGTKREGVTQVVTSNGHLRRIDLTRPFTVSKIDTVEEQSIPLSDQVPRMSIGNMWAHNTTIYLGPSNLENYPLLQNGAWTNETRIVPTKGIWTYDTANPDAGWTRLSNLGYNDTFNPVMRASVAFLDDVSYIIGGRFFATIMLERGTFVSGRQIPLSSLYKLDMERKVSINETSSIGHLDSGRVVAIENVGQNGILVYIGGMRSEGFNDMSTIRVYDIASSTWKIQKATSKDGNSPRGRIDFCAVAMSAQDHSSHQIYFYGGYYNEGEFGQPFTLDDLWVLTLPSFQFIKVGNSPEAARDSGTCGVISPQYLLAYRGDFWKADRQRFNSLGDVSLALLDLTDLEWKTEYTPANSTTVYRVPQKVIEIIGGDETGNAISTAPSGGFSDKSLAAIFNLSSPKKPTSSSISASPSPSARGGSTPKSPYATPLKNRVVIGVSIACAAVAALSIAGITSLFRQRQRNKLHALQNELRQEALERQEADGNIIVPVKYELEGSRPVVYEIGSDENNVGVGEQ